MQRQFLLLVISFCLSGTTVSFGQPIAPLLNAIKNNDTKEVARLLNDGAAITVVDSDSDNVLTYAALYASADCMQLLLKKAANPNASNKLGETALMWCSHNLQKTKLLLENNANVNAATKKGNTPLLIAAVGQNQNQMMQLLLQYGADALHKNKKDATALMGIAAFGDTVIANLLLKKGVNINARTTESETALMLAVKGMNKPMVSWLLHNGADANSTDGYNATALSYAVVLNDADLVKMLLKVTKDINAPDIDSMTCLMWATYNEHDNPKIIQALLDAGAAVNLKDTKGHTALWWASKKGSTATVVLLKKVGAE